MSGSLVETYRGMVTAWECDVFAHLNIAFYVERFADAATDLMDRLAPGQAWRTEAISTRYAVELRAGEGIAIRSGIIEIGAASLRIGHEAINTATGKVTTSAEQVLVPESPENRAWEALRTRLGSTLAAWTAPRFAPVALPAGQGPIPSGRDRIKPWELDAAGRLALLGYLHRCSNACLQVLDAIGMSDTYRRSAQRGYATFDTRLSVLSEAPRQGEGIAVTSGVLDLGTSSLRMLHRLHAVGSGRLLAEFYQAGANFDLAARRSAPFAADLRERALALRFVAPD